MAYERKGTIPFHDLTHMPSGIRRDTVKDGESSERCWVIGSSTQNDVWVVLECFKVAADHVRTVETYKKPVMLIYGSAPI